LRLRLGLNRRQDEDVSTAGSRSCGRCVSDARRVRNRRNRGSRRRSRTASLFFRRKEDDVLAISQVLVVVFFAEVDDDEGLSLLLTIENIEMARDHADNEGNDQESADHSTNADDDGNNDGKNDKKDSTTTSTVAVSTITAATVTATTIATRDVAIAVSAVSSTAVAHAIGTIAAAIETIAAAEAVAPGRRTCDIPPPPDGEDSVVIVCCGCVGRGAAVTATVAHALNNRVDDVATADDEAQQGQASHKDQEKSVVEQLPEAGIAVAGIVVGGTKEGREVSDTLDAKDDETAEDNNSTDNGKNADDVDENEQVETDVGPGADLARTKMVFLTADITGCERRGILRDRTPFVQAVSVDPAHRSSASTGGNKITS